MAWAGTGLQEKEAGPCAQGCRQSQGWGGWTRCADEIFREALQRAEPKRPPAHGNRQEEAVGDHGAHRESHEGERWKLVTSGNGRTAAAAPADLQLHSRHRALTGDEGQKVLSGEASEPQSCRRTRRNW